MPHQLMRSRIPLGGQAIRHLRVLLTSHNMQPVDLRYITGEVGPGPHLRDVPRQIRQAARLGAHQLVLAEQPLRQVACVRVCVDRDGRGAAQLREDQPHPHRG